MKPQRFTKFSPLRPRRRPARGSVLILATGLTVVLTGLLLVFARQMRVEALATDNLAASLQADAIVSGAAQHVLNRLTTTQDQTLLDSEIKAEGVALGAGWFWLLRPDPEDERRYDYGITDESSRLNINTASVSLLLGLPGMTAELAASIVDWRDGNETVGEGGGAESGYYLMLPEPYYCKNGAFETLEELRLIKGATPELLFGADRNRNFILDENENGGQALFGAFEGQTQCGLSKYLTVYSAEPNTSRTGQPRLYLDGGSSTVSALLRLLGDLEPQRRAELTTRISTAGRCRNVLDFYVKSGLTPEEFGRVADLVTTTRDRVLRGRINVNTAPREVLRCLPGLAESDVELLLSRRNGSEPGRDSLAWVAETLEGPKAAAIGDFITVRSYQYSADIVGVSANGRGFKCCRYVFDLRTTPPRVLYRRDLTHLGWPLSAELWTAIRAGTAATESSMGRSWRTTP